MFQMRIHLHVDARDCAGDGSAIFKFYRHGLVCQLHEKASPTVSNDLLTHRDDWLSNDVPNELHDES